MGWRWIVVMAASGVMGGTMTACGDSECERLKKDFCEKCEVATQKDGCLDTVNRGDQDVCGDTLTQFTLNPNWCAAL